eukprot:1640560-Amphidinium_carterae.1
MRRFPEFRSSVAWLSRVCHARLVVGAMRGYVSEGHAYHHASQHQVCRCVCGQLLSKPYPQHPNEPRPVPPITKRSNRITNKGDVWK